MKNKTINFIDKNKYSGEQNGIFLLNLENSNKINSYFTSGPIDRKKSENSRQICLISPTQDTNHINWKYLP